MCIPDHIYFKKGHHTLTPKCNHTENADQQRSSDEHDNNIINVRKPTSNFN